MAAESSALAPPTGLLRHSFRSRGWSPTRRGRLGQAGLGPATLPHPLPAASLFHHPLCPQPAPTGFERGAPILPPSLAGLALHSVLSAGSCFHKLVSPCRPSLILYPLGELSKPSQLPPPPALPLPPDMPSCSQQHKLPGRPSPPPGALSR